MTMYDGHVPPDRSCGIQAPKDPLEAWNHLKKLAADVPVKRTPGRPDGTNLEDPAIRLMIK